MTTAAPSRTSLGPAGVSAPLTPAGADHDARVRAHEAAELLRVQAALRTAFADALGAPAVDAAFSRALGRFADAPVRVFVPLLVERAVRAELRAAAAAHRQEA